MSSENISDSYNQIHMSIHKLKNLTTFKKRANKHGVHNKRRKQVHRSQVKSHRSFEVGLYVSTH